MEERLRKRIEDLTVSRKNYEIEAQRTLFAMDAAIGELKEILEPTPETAPLTPTGEMLEHTNGVAVTE